MDGSKALVHLSQAATYEGSKDKLTRDIVRVHHASGMLGLVMRSVWARIKTLGSERWWKVGTCFLLTTTPVILGTRKSSHYLFLQHLVGLSLGLSQRSRWRKHTSCISIGSFGCQGNGLVCKCTDWSSYCSRWLFDLWLTLEESADDLRNEANVITAIAHGPNPAVLVEHLF